MSTFGDYWGEDEQSFEPTATGEQPMLPDGKHVGKIVVAEVKNVPFKETAANEKGTSLVVKVAVNGYQLAEDIVPVNMRGIVEAIFRSAGIDPPTKGESFEAACGRLKGQTAPIESTLVVAKSGREYVRIKWLPGVKPLAPAAKTETRVRKPRVETSAPDDIPF